MDNKKLIALGIDMLNYINPEEVETVQVDRTKYDDGSVMYSVNVTLPATTEEEK